MKKLSTVLLILIIVESTLFSQEIPQFYQTENQKYTIEFHDSQCVLYELSGHGAFADVYHLKPERPFRNPMDSLGILYSNEFFVVSYDFKYFRVSKLTKKGKVKDRNTYVARSLQDPGKVYEAVNREYWYTIYEKTNDELESEFPMFLNHQYGFNLRSETWAVLSFKQAHPKEFKILADARNMKLKDSLTAVNQYYLGLLNSLETGADSLDLEKWKLTYSQFPTNESVYSRYTQEAVNTIAEERPDLFFGLVETLPAEEKYLFSRVYSKEATRSLKSYETDAPVKKEYFKFKRRANFKFIMTATGVIILEAGIITGLIALIFI